MQMNLSGNRRGSGNALPWQRSALSLAAGLLYCSGTAFAQEATEPAPVPPDSGVGIEEIVVTAQKREESLQEVPIAVTALSSEMLEERGIDGLSDFVRTPTPGVSIQSFSGASSIIIVDIRGVANPDPGQGTAELGTAIYIDDVYLGRAQGLGADLADPERIEVLRGPQGTLFGRNAEGGAVRIVSKKPTGEFGGNLKTTFADYGTERYEAHVNLPAVAGVAVKLDGLISKRDGYTDNGPQSDDIDEQLGFASADNSGFRASLRWEPLSALLIDYAYDQSRSENTGDYYVLVAPSNTSASYVPQSAFLGEQLDDSVYERVDESFTTLFLEPFIDESEGHTLAADYLLSEEYDLKLRSISSYRELDNSGSQQLGGAFNVIALGPAGVPVEAFAARPDTSGIGVAPGTSVYAVSGVIPFVTLGQHQVTQELQLIGSTDQLEYVAGLYYFREKVKDIRQTYFSIMYTEPGTPTFANAVGTNPFSLPFAGQGATSNEAESTSYAAFSQVTWTPMVLEQRLHLTAGLRYTNDEKTFFRGLQGGSPTDLRPDPFEEERFDPAATVAFDITDDVNTYLRYSQAYRAGGVNVRSPTFAPYDAEVNEAVEIGLKSDLFERRMRANLAAFQNRISDQQLTVQVDPDNPTVTDTINAPGTTLVQGVEMELLAAPGGGFLLSFNYAYQDSELPDDLETVDPNATYYIPNLFEHSGSVGVDYTLPPLAFGEVLVHADYSLASKAASTVRIPDDGYAWESERNVANARVTLQDIPAGPVGLKVAAFVNNVFDEAYPVFTATGAQAVLLAPRVVGIEFGVEF